MKKILLVLLSFSMASGLFAQSFTLSDTNGMAIDHGSTYQVIGDPSDGVITAKIYVKNNATAAKDVKVKKIINDNDVLPLTINSFCWGIQCYPPDTYESPFPLTIEPGATVTNFYGEYQPMTVPGISKVLYVFFDINDRNDSVAVVVEYNASPASVGDDLAGQVTFSAAYPNPAMNSVKIDYTLPSGVKSAAIVINNMLGSEVKKVELEEKSGTARIQVADFLNGIYFYSLVADDKLVMTRKFVVKH